MLEVVMFLVILLVLVLVFVVLLRVSGLAHTVDGLFDQVALLYRLTRPAPDDERMPMGTPVGVQPGPVPTPASPVFPVPPRYVPQPPAASPVPTSSAPAFASPVVVPPPIPVPASPVPAPPAAPVPPAAIPLAQPRPIPAMQQVSSNLTAPRRPASPASPPVPAGTTAVPSRSAENVFGRNILGIIASVLVFLGLIFLGVLVVPHLTDAMKIALMFIVSAVLTAAGYLLNHRYSNNFTQALLGTGLGAFFISVLVTHLYFQAINEIVAFSLLAVWTAGSLLVSRQSKSLLVAILAHVGMVVSVCLGYGLGLTDDQLIALIVYQFVSTAILVVGNIWCCRRMYRFGLFASLALMVYASLVMWVHFAPMPFFDSALVGFASSLHTGLIAAAFLVQFLGGTFLAYLLFVSCLRVKQRGLAVSLLVINVALWHGLLIVDVGWLAAKLVNRGLGIPSGMFFFNSYRGVLAGVLATSLIMAIVAATVVMVRRRVQFAAEFESVTVLILAGAVSVQLLVSLSVQTTLNAAGPRLAWLAIPGLLLLGGGRLAGNRVLSVGGRALLAADAVCMTMLGTNMGYGSLIAIGGLWLAAAYLIVLTALSYVVWRGFGAPFKTAQTPWYRFVMVVAFELSLARIVWQSAATYGWALWVAVSIAVLWVLHVAKRDTPVEVYRVAEAVIALAITAHLLLGTTGGLAKALCLVAALASFVLALERVRGRAAENARALREHVQPGPDVIEYLTAISLTLVFIAVLDNLIPGFTWQYPTSLAGLVIALVIIALGFWSRTRPLRLYGLIVTILGVLKLVTVDLWGSGTMIMQVVAFIGGGLVCFGISALYNFAVKRFERTDAVAAAVPGENSVPE